MTVANSNYCNDSIVCVLIGTRSWENVIGSEGGDYFILIWLLWEGSQWVEIFFLF